jgi:phytoene desaturase
LSEALTTLAKEQGAKIVTCSEITAIKASGNKVTGVEIRDKNNISVNHECDFVISSADYHFSETLLEEKYRNYSEKYWQKKVFAPSALLFYVGFNKKLRNISHHTLFFDTSFEEHATTIYDTHTWPDNPLFYASFPSVTDPSMAPEGKECGIFLIPLSSGLKEDPTLREKYLRQIINRTEKLTGQELYSGIEVMHSYGVRDFVTDYHSYKGNAYGLSNILTQTAFLKPKMRNRKLPNLLYCGQLTVPGPGVPPTLISGTVAARLADKYLKNGQTL